MENKIEYILDKLIADIQDGKSINDCLSEYGEYADELRPLLELCQRMRSVPGPEPDEEKVAGTVRKALTILTERQHRRRPVLREIVTFRPVLARISAIIAVVLLITMTTVTLSANSLPGDALYSVKLLAERVQYFLAFDAKGRARLHLMFANRRTHEFSCLFEPGRPFDRELLSNMLSETSHAIGQIQLLDTEQSARLIEQVRRCNQVQLTVLEDARANAHDHDIEVVEQAIRKCAEQHECIECMKGSD